MNRIVDLPTECVDHIALYLDHDDLHALELTCSLLRQCCLLGAYWKKLAQRLLTTTSSREFKWKNLACACASMEESDQQAKQASLLQHVHEASSVDRADAESPSNTLHISHCYREMRRLRSESACQNLFDYTIQRLMCSCPSGHCYWSSAPSFSRAHDDFIEYAILGPCILAAIGLIPYKAFWQLGSPGYAPLEVSISLIRADAQVYYTSPCYSVANSMELQTFDLPQRVLLLQDTRVRVNFLGKRQYEYDMLESDEPRRYYCCLSYVGVTGLLLPSDFL
ncbi:unnamed protein product [Aphanomyces euteiches]